MAGLVQPDWQSARSRAGVSEVSGRAGVQNPAEQQAPLPGVQAGHPDRCAEPRAQIVHPELAAGGETGRNSLPFNDVQPTGGDVDGELLERVHLAAQTSAKTCILITFPLLDCGILTEL